MLMLVVDGGCIFIYVGIGDSAPCAEMNKYLMTVNSREDQRMGCWVIYIIWAVVQFRK